MSKKIYVLRLDIPSVKYAKIRASFGPYFPVYDSGNMDTGKRGNMDTILFIYGKIRIRESQYFGIFQSVLLNIVSHNLDLREKVLLVRENYSCANI